MRSLLRQIQNVPISIKDEINQKLEHFGSFKNTHTNEWFSEVCFCILTSNSKAITAINIQNELGSTGFINHDADTIRDSIIRNKHRFHNNKTKFIIEARKHVDIKDKLQGMDNISKRQWLVQNIKGLGYKEASHFLRNTGHFNLAILDRHILRIMLENGLIPEIPKSITKIKYLDMETKLAKLCTKLGMSQAELDFYLWYMKTGKVLK